MNIGATIVVSDKKTRSINVMVLFKNQMDVFQSFFLEAFYFKKVHFREGKILYAAKDKLG